MARIRSIKPETPQSASLGAVSRDARLCFILLWTIADDHGRLRGAPLLLANTLFPYDEDAPGLIEGWLDELVGQGSIVRYQAKGQHYVAIPGWSDHQRVDHPSKPKLPAPDAEGSVIIAKSSETLASNSREQITDVPAKTSADSPAPSRGSRETIGEEGKGREKKGEERSLSSEPPAGPRQRGGLIRGPGQQARLLQRNAFAGERVMVPHDKHDEFRRALGGSDADQRLRAWYLELDERVTRTNEPINYPNEWKWLQAQFEAWRASAAHPSDGLRSVDEALAAADRERAAIAAETAAAKANGTWRDPMEAVRAAFRPGVSRGR